MKKQLFGNSEQFKNKKVKKRIMEILIYKSENDVQVEVSMDKETVWLSQRQMGTLFNKHTDTIGLHLKNIYQEEELQEKATTEDYSVVQKEGNRNVKRKIKFYNLDAIISVGYRVNSKEGVQFRQWATQRLKDYLIKGYAINQKRIEKNKAQFLETLEDLKLLTSHTTLEAKDVLSLIQSFSDTWFNLEQFDKGNFPKISNQTLVAYNAEELENDLQKLKQELIRKKEATNLFAQEKREGSFKGIFNTIFQTVFGADAYDSTEEKAAHLLYFVVKNHPFNDGNKRSAAFSFIWFLHKSKLEFANKISPETLTTLTILIAQSPPEDRDKMIGMILLLLNKR